MLRVYVAGYCAHPDQFWFYPHRHPCSTKKLQDQGSKKPITAHVPLHCDSPHGDVSGVLFLTSLSEWCVNARNRHHVVRIINSENTLLKRIKGMNHG